VPQKFGTASIFRFVDLIDVQLEFSGQRLTEFYSQHFTQNFADKMQVAVQQRLAAAFNMRQQQFLKLRIRIRHRRHQHRAQQPPRIGFQDFRNYASGADSVER